MSYGYHPTYPPTRYDYGSLEPLEPVRRSAPPSVHTVAIMQYLGGLALLLGGAAAMLFALGSGRYLDQGQVSPIAVDLRDMGLAVGAVLVFGGLLTIAIGRRLQRGRQWARVLVLVLSVLSIATTLYNGLVAQGDTNVLLGLVIPVLYVALLNTSAARSWFRGRSYRGAGQRSAL